MRWKLGLLAAFTLLGREYFFSPIARAQCIQADVSVQYNISGSQQPTERTNDVDFQSHDGCRGNVSVTTGVQGNIGGTDRVQQHRVVRHQFNRDESANQSLPTKKDNLGSSTIQIQSNPAIDVYNAADHLEY